MKTRPILFNSAMVRALLDGRKTQTRRVVKSNCQEIVERDDGSMWPWREDCERGGNIWYPCPYGKPGDLIWVRETFRDATRAFADRVLYKADGDICCGWQPSIHMPRWASRLTLEITGVRVEPLTAISEEDAAQEGGYRVSLGGGPWSYRNGFRNIWDDVYADQTLGWTHNPWVWVITFNVHHCNVDQFIKEAAA